MGPTIVHGTHHRARDPPSCTEPNIVHGTHHHAWAPQSCMDPTIVHGTHHRARGPPSCTGPNIVRGTHYHAWAPPSFMGPTIVHGTHHRALAPPSCTGPTQPPMQQVPVFFAERSTGRGVKLTSQPHLVSRLSMSGAIPLFPLHVFMTWTKTTWPLNLTC